MNVVVVIDGREAIPVRAIPLLTNWITMSPDQVACALAWDGYGWKTRKLQSHRVEDGRVRPIPQSWWRNFGKKNIEAIADRVRAAQITDSTGYQDWQRASLKELPAGCFVWKDEYESVYSYAFGSDGPTFMTDAGQAMSEEAQAEYVALDYDPFIPDEEFRQAAMEGFQLLRGSTSAPIIATVASGVSSLEHSTKISEDVRTGPMVSEIDIPPLDGANRHIDGRFESEPSPPYIAAPEPSVQEIPVLEPEPVGVDSQYKGVEDWKMQCQAEAYEYWIRKRSTGANPTVRCTVTHVATWCAKNNILTTGHKKPPRQGYLRTHVLGGNHWIPPNISVEAAKAHVAQVAQAKNNGTSGSCTSGTNS